MSKPVFLYAGQGSQRAGMGKDIYEAFPTFAHVIDSCGLSKEQKTLMFEGPQELLSQTENTQPALAAFAAGVTAVLAENGITPAIAAGLSLGEYSALHAAGVFDAQTLIKVTTYRGQQMQAAAEGKTCQMIAVMGIEAPALEEICAEAAKDGMVVITNYNAKGQIVIAGDDAPVRHAAELAKEAGAKKCVELEVSSAFHTSYMEPASEALREFFPTIAFGEMQIPVVFNTTARPLSEGETIQELLVRQVKSPVRMQETLEYLAAEGYDTAIEIGPGKTLSGFVRRTVKGIKTMAVDDAESLQKVIDAFASAE